MSFISHFRIVYYLMNIKVVPRTIYLSRHGQSQYNSVKKLGGDSDLTDCGAEYSRSVIGPLSGLHYVKSIL